MRWTEAQFFALPAPEQHRWLAWEVQRQARVREVVKDMLSDAKPSAEVITAKALLALLQLD